MIKRIRLILKSALIASSLGYFAPICFAEDLRLNLASESEQVVGVEKQHQEESSVYFESRLQINQEGKPDLTPLYSCGTRELDAFKVPNVEHTQRLLTFQNSPVISKQINHLQGKVTVRDSRSMIAADEVLINQEEQKIYAKGGVSIESVDAFFRAENLVQDQVSNTTDLERAQFYLFSNHANGTAENIQILADKETHLKEVTFTTCPLDDESWVFEMSEMKLNQKNGWGEAWDTTIKLADIPVFYLPYINFPMDERRKSGLLAPILRNNDINGIDYAQPIYWNIAPDKDATIIPRVIQQRGVQLGGEFRLLTLGTESEVYFEWLGKDRLAKAELQTPNSQIAQGLNSEQRWLATFKHKAKFNSHWGIDLNTRRVSDKNYLNDFNTNIDSASRTQLSSRVSLHYRDDIWDMELFTLVNQSLVETQNYHYLPSFNLNSDYLDTFGLRWQLNSEWSFFEHEQLLRLEGYRRDLMPSVSYPMRNSWGFIIPKVSYQISDYEQTNQLTEETTKISRDLPISSLDMGLYFDRDLKLFEKEYTHSLIPRLFYVYIPYRNQQGINVFDTNLSGNGFQELWRENRFSGIDRVGDTNHISFAVTNSLTNNVTGEKLFDFKLGRKYYLEDSFVGLRREALQNNDDSPWLAEVNFKLNDSFNFSSFIEWDQRLDQTNEARSSIQFEPWANHIVNLSHRYRNITTRETEESDFSFAWPVSERWRLVGRWYHDLDFGQTIDSFLGVEYESCCWAVRLLAQRYLNTTLAASGEPIELDDERYSQSISLQFIFKGVGSAGQSGLGEFLESNIDGYQDPFIK